MSFEQEIDKRAKLMDYPNCHGVMAVDTATIKNLNRTFNLDKQKVRETIVNSRASGRTKKCLLRDLGLDIQKDDNEVRK